MRRLNSGQVWYAIQFRDTCGIDIEIKIHTRDLTLEISKNSDDNGTEDRVFLDPSLETLTELRDLLTYIINRNNEK